MPDFGPRWKLVQNEPIGKGGQGSAYLVRDAGGVNHVAKVFRGSDEKPNRRKRLLAEIEACKSFDHPNVAKFVDSGETVKNSYPFLVLPYYDGGTLKPQIGRDPLEVLRLFLAVCEGVAHIHIRGFVHRDLKPSNVLLTNGRPVVADFGLCYTSDTDSLTETNEVVAPRWFGAPELRNGHLEQPKASADVYSLGKLLYWLFTGKVYDREEQEYGAPDRKLVAILPRRFHGKNWNAASFVDDLIEQTVRYEPEERLYNADLLRHSVEEVILRIERKGNALDLRLPMHCVF